MFNRKLKRKIEALEGNISKLEKKSVPTTTFELFGLSTAGKMQWSEISNSIAWTYYKQVSVIYNAINIISQAYAIIKPRIWDNVEERYLTDEDSKTDVFQLLERLKMPTFGMSYVEFAKQMIPNYLVTGDLFLMIQAINDKRPPTELSVINSQDVGFDEEDLKGFTTRYTVNYSQFSLSFTRDDKTGRFYSPNRMQELWHTKIFNPTDKQKGFSPLNPTFYEIEQFIAAAIHNGNLLKQGARPSGVLTIDQETNLSEINYTRLKEQVQTFYSGSQNAGKVLILQGGKEFKELSVSNKDMDFSTLKKTDVEQMYRNLGIPMSLVLSNSMTLDNFKMAIPVLYKMTALPIADIIFQEMNLLLMPRYDTTGRYELTYNKRDIDALEAEFNAEVDRLIKTQLLTINEGRGLLDLTPLEGEAGNEIFTPSTLIPIGQVELQKQMTKEEYTDLLRKNKTFSEDQINEYIKKYYNEY